MTTPSAASPSNGSTAHAELGPGRRSLRRLDRYLADAGSGATLVAGYGLLFLIWLVDVLTGPRVSLSLFYLLPVAVLTWRLGRLPGTIVAVASSMAWMIADLSGGLYSANSLVAYWNTAVRLSVLLLVTSMLAVIREGFQRERDLALQKARTAETLTDLNELKQTLLHAISHDLRGPITAILGSAQSLQRKEELKLTSDQEEGLLAAVVTNGRKLNRLITDLLDLERLDRGMIEPDREQADLGALSRKIVNEADYLADHPVRVEAGNVEISIDVGKVERILENLLRNAAKHTPTGTPILVRVTGGPDDATVSVEDEGPGIPADMKEFLFQPFRQGAAARATGSGVGIGLSLVAKFAELHGGAAWVEDRPGGGTAFRVLLPHKVPIATATVSPEAPVPRRYGASLTAS